MSAEKKQTFARSTSEHAELHGAHLNSLADVINAFTNVVDDDAEGQKILAAAVSIASVPSQERNHVV